MYKSYATIYKDKGEDGLKTMGDLAESASSSNEPLAQPGGFLMFQTFDYE